MAPRSARSARPFLADTAALLSFFTLTGALNELFIVGMEPAEVLRARLIGAPLMVLTARPYGIWRDRVMAWAGPGGALARTLWDSLALLTFQVPIYVGIIYAGGARGGALIVGGLGAAVMMLLLGRPYGAWLGLVRRWFGLPAEPQDPAARPMSPNP